MECAFARLRKRHVPICEASKGFAIELLTELPAGGTSTLHNNGEPTTKTQEALNCGVGVPACSPLTGLRSSMQPVSEMTSNLQFTPNANGRSAIPARAPWNVKCVWYAGGQHSTQGSRTMTKDVCIEMLN